MTLVVARQVDHDVYIVGDTKFSATEDAGRSRSEQYLGGLKVVILAPGLCVGFAGNVEIARDAIQGVMSSEVNLFDKNQAIEHFLQHHLASVRLGPKLETDFIIAAIVESDQEPGTFVKEMFRIAESKVHWENEACHIGGAHAFGRFQEAFHNGVPRRDVALFEVSRLGAAERPAFHQSLTVAMRAMQAVIDDPDISGVDGVRTVVISEDDQFRYVEYLQVQGHPVPVNNAPGAAVSFGGAPEGSDAKHVGMLSAVGNGVFPVYWITGRFGVIYHPEKSFEPEIHRDCTEEEFCARVREHITNAHQRALQFQSRY